MCIKRSTKSKTVFLSRDVRHRRAATCERQTRKWLTYKVSSFSLKKSGLDLRPASRSIPRQCSRTMLSWKRQWSLVSGAVLKAPRAQLLRFAARFVVRQKRISRNGACERASVIIIATLSTAVVADRTDMGSRPRYGHNTETLRFSRAKWKKKVFSVCPQAGELLRLFCTGCRMQCYDAGTKVIVNRVP